MRALEHDGPSLVEVPIDYRENLRLTERLGALAVGDLTASGPAAARVQALGAFGFLGFGGRFGVLSPMTISSCRRRMSCGLRRRQR